VSSAYLIHHFVEAAADVSPEREFIVQLGGRFGYGEIDAGANRIANLLLRLGLEKGQRVGLLSRNCKEYVESYYGILKAGGVAVPLNTAANAAQLREFVSDCEARFLIAGPRMERLLNSALGILVDVNVLLVPDLGRIKEVPAHIEAVSLDEAARESDERPGVDVVDQDVASIIYTSGSTGRPRGATLTHLNVVTNTKSIVRYLDLRREDRVLAILPFYYVYGKSLLNTHALARGTVVIENRFQYPNTALDTLEQEACTGFSGVPASFAILLNRSNLAERELAHLRYVTQAGGAMSPALTRRLMEALPGKRIFVMYGATEASARLSYLPPEELASAVGSIGRAIPNVELRVLRADGSEAELRETGELVARGSNIMRGYWRDADETARVLDQHGYHTGDLAYRDDRGLLYVVGRKKDMIKSGGHRIAAKEIEDVILEHGDVHETAVIGVPDEILGERIKAFVVLRESGSVDASTLTKFLGPRVPGYKLPHIIEFRDELPKNESGKIMKQALRAE